MIGLFVCDVIALNLSFKRRPHHPRRDEGRRVTPAPVHGDYSDVMLELTRVLFAKFCSVEAFLIYVVDDI